MRHEISVSEFSPIIREFASFKTVIQGCSQRTVEQYLIDLRTFFRYLLCEGDAQVLHDPDKFRAITVESVDLDYLRNITTDQIYDFLLFADSERDNQTAAKARKLAAIRALFKFLVNKRGYLTDNPAANIDSPKKKKALPKFLSLEEARALLAAVWNDTDSPNRERDFCIITLFLNCGMRVGELVGINLQDIDPALRSLRVLGKGNKERIIYLNEACRAALQEYLAVRKSERYAQCFDRALFVTNRMARISIQGVQVTVQKYLKMAGLESKHYSVHKLRHTAATLMYQSGAVDIRVLKDILGHEQLNTTQIYTHVSNRNMEEAMRHNPLAGDVGRDYDADDDKDEGQDDDD
ncbi:MAG: tyrosine recombinase XerC [Clostridia bacterium]|nr:tyrosine recombinase XerC [Clostridia bacterium]